MLTFNRSRGWWSALPRWDGVAAIEFAMLFPLFLVTLLAVFEVAMTLFVAVSMDAGLRAAGRFGMTGCLPASASSRYSYAEQLIVEHTLGLVDLDNAELVVTAYSSPAELASPELGVDQSSALGMADNIVTYQLSYDWPLFTARFIEALSVDGKIPLSAVIAVKNEPWPDDDDDGVSTEGC